MCILTRTSTALMLVLVFFFFLSSSYAVAHKKTGRPAPQERLIGVLSEQFDRSYVESLFNTMGAHYRDAGARCTELDGLVRTDLARIKQGKAPTTGHLLTREKSLGLGLAYWQKNRSYFDATEERYGVPAEVVLGILRMETRLGECLGIYNAFPALYDTYRTGARNLKWVRAEMEALIRLCLARGCDPNDMPSSVRGAFGISQFLPTSFWAFAVDGDGDGVTDLFSDADAIVSVANYLSKHGFDKNAKRGTACRPAVKDKQRRAIWNYNQTCKDYVEPVLRYADAVHPLLEKERSQSTKE